MIRKRGKKNTKQQNNNINALKDIVFMLLKKWEILEHLSFLFHRAVNK